MPLIRSSRLQLASFQLSDAADVFACITPAITRYLTWDPPTWDQYLALCEERQRINNPNEVSFVIRRSDTSECLGVAAFEHADQPAPEIGLWLKENAHGHGYGREVVEALITWASKSLGKESFTYPVAVQNTASRRVAEGLSGTIIASVNKPKYEAVIYRIPRKV